MKSTVIVITGLPATGKTTLGIQLATHFKVPFLSKDVIKELIFDHLGVEDREFSKKTGRAAYAILYEVADQLMRSGSSFIIESNFKPAFDNATFSAIKEKYAPEFIQVLCWANGEVLLERFAARAESGDRHPGHVDSGNLDEFSSSLLQGRSEPLDIDGKLIEVDTTDFTKIDVDQIIKEISHGSHFAN